MPFDPDQHYRNCQDAVAHMSAIAREPGEVLVRNTPVWDALRKSLSEIGIGAAAAFAAIRDAGAEGDYNDAYLSMLRLASNLLGLESLALAHDRIEDADDSFEMCRDYANAIRDPLELGSFAELRAVPRHDSLAASSRPLLTRLGAVFGHALSAGELVPNANRIASAPAPGTA